MKLTGIIEDVFRGVTIFRGYATLKTLARLSASTSYQRDKDPDRIDAIKDYISNSSYVFYPELILGWQLDNPDAIRIIKEEENTSSVSLNNGIKIKKAKFKFKSLPLGEEPKTKVVTIEIPDSINETIFNRIDGNHRLSVVDMIKDETGAYDSDICNQVVPFSLIIQNESIEANKCESAYFYLINSKAKALTTEDNLKAIFKADFSDIEKELLLSIDKPQIDCIQYISEYLKGNPIDFVQDKEIFDSEIYTFSCKLAKIVANTLSNFSDDKKVELLYSIKYINSIFITRKIKTDNREVFLALVIVHYAQNDIFDKFVEWINTNDVGTIENLDCEHIIQLFDTLHKQKFYKVFVAVPYISFNRVNEYNKLFKEVLSEISKKIGFGLELIPIMRFRGESQRIDQRLINCIKECDIFVGDLSTVNDNVIFEVGLAEGCGKKILLIKAEEDTDRILFDQATNLGKGKIVPFDMDKLQYIPYSNSGYYNDIKRIIRNHIPVIVEQLRKECHV